MRDANRSLHGIVEDDRVPLSIGELDPNVAAVSAVSHAASAAPQTMPHW